MWKLTGLVAIAAIVAACSPAAPDGGGPAAPPAAVPGATAPAPAAPVRAAIPLDGRYVFSGSDTTSQPCAMTLEPDEGHSPRDVLLGATCIQHYLFLATLDGWTESPMGGIRLVANGGSVIGDFRRQPDGSYGALVTQSGKVFSLTPMGLWRGPAVR